MKRSSMANSPNVAAESGRIARLSIGVRDSQWVYRGAFGELEIELRSGGADPGGQAESIRQLRSMIWAFQYGEPAAHRVVMEIYGQVARVTQGASFDPGSPRAREIGEEL